MIDFFLDIIALSEKMIIESIKKDWIKTKKDKWSFFAF
jgi:hypothetical protein